MPKRKSLILFTMVFAIVALLVSSEAMAGTRDCSLEWGLPAGSCTELDIGYSVRFNRFFTDNGLTCFEWIGWKHLKNANINQLHGAFNGGLTVESQNAGDDRLFPPGEGSTFDNVGAGFSDWIVSWTPVPTAQELLQICISGEYQWGTSAWIATGDKQQSNGSTVGPIPPEPIVPPDDALLGKTISRENVGDMICYFKEDGDLIGCYNNAGELLPNYPTDAVTCTLTNEESSTSQTIQFDIVSDETTVAGHGSPDAIWYYYRGRWYCSGTLCP
jgi:hypothetical protein